MSYTYSYNSLVIDNLPLNKETAKHISWLDILVQPVQRLNDLLYYYDTGSTFSFYTASSTYSVGSRINGGLTYNNAVFEANKITSGTFSTSDWDLVLPTFIGFEERVKYVDSRVVFEWALNRHFRTTFVQPNFADTAKSDIYIDDTTLANNASVFLIGPTDFTSGFIGLLNSTLSGPGSANVWVGLDPTQFPAGTASFIIWVPNSVYITLPGYTGVTQSADIIIRNYANKINYSGMPFQIKTY